MMAPARPVKVGVRRRLKQDVPETLHHGGVELPVKPGRGEFVIDAVSEAKAEIRARKNLANCLKSR